jgi:HD-like signal output (HDOD) protein
MRALWQSSTRVAAISAVLARFASGIDSERAMLAGLMHDIGVLTIIQYASSDKSNSYTEAEIQSAVRRLKGVLGAAVLRHWNFEPEIAQVPLCIADMEEHIPGPATYCDVVRVAKMHSLFGTSELADYPPLIELSSFKKFGFSLEGPDASIEALREAKADIEAVRQTLNI